MDSLNRYIEASGLSNAEFYRLNGTMSIDRIEALLDREAAAPDLGGVACDVDEAKAGFPDEDCAAALIERMQKLAKRMRGDTRRELLELVAELETLQTSLANSAEYGCEKLKSAIQALEACNRETPITNAQKDAA
ncbi:hypothetical protein ACQKRQ_34310 [Paraburkholderia sp. NPDC080076]|jgi:hypothetical protein|uniref:hypothetical protein n=1 Tax=Paraburkholderia sp. NPDC080076 TaxID=3390605 RepID=UPI003CFFEDF0